MTAPISTTNLCQARTLQHQNEARNNARAMSEAIERSADPLSGESAERPFMVPQGHDPYDIWHHILVNVTVPEDLSKLWGVCSLFREIACLKKKYIQTMLPQIVQLILDKRPTFLLDNEEIPANGGVQHVSLPRSILLDLRKISRQCKNSAEELLIQAGGFTSKKLFVTLKTAAQVQGIIDSILGREIMVGNFFPVNVRLAQRDVYNNQIFIQEGATLHETFRIFLELVGKRVRTFRYNSRGQPLDVLHNLAEWVVYMPNLETLELFPKWFRNGTARITDLEAAFSNCPRLKSFVHDSWQLPYLYVRHILRTNPHISAISLPEWNSKKFMDSGIINTLQHLECLHTPVSQSLLSNLELRMPLKKIVFHGVRGASSSKLYVFLHHFRESLEHLELKVGLEETGEYFLDLPNLKYLRWRHNKTIEDFQFLLHAGRLEEMQIVVSSKVPSPKAFFDRFLEKVTQGFDGLTIWEVFPRLRRFLTEFSRNQKRVDMYRN